MLSCAVGSGCRTGIPLSLVAGWCASFATTHTIAATTCAYARLLARSRRARWRVPTLRARPERAELARALTPRAAHLSTVRREVVLLHDIEGLRHREISRHWESRK